MAAIRDLSDTLDILGAKPSDVLVRGPDRWQTTTAIQAGQALLSGPIGQAPSWQTLSGGTGLWQMIEDVTLPTTLAVNVYHQTTVPANAQEIEYSYIIPAISGGVTPAFRFNADAGNHYNVINRIIISTPAQQLARLLNQTLLRIIHSTGTPMQNVHWCEARIMQPAINGAVFVRLTAITQDMTTTDTMAFWLPSPTAALSQIGLTSTAPNGLPAATRIVVRAAIP